MQTKFKRGPGESVLMKGDLNYHVGEPGVMNMMKGKYKVTECNGILTSTRFVACKKQRYFPWGPLIWIFIYFFFSNKIVFEIPLTSLASIRSEGGKSKMFILKTHDGFEFNLTSATIFDKRPAWLQAIKDAVVRLSPGMKVQENETSIEFVQA